MTAREIAEAAKKNNVIDMALTFTAMMRVFTEGSKGKITMKLQDFFLKLNAIYSREDYKIVHQSFCDWFTSEIRTAARKLKNGRIKKSVPASYGQAAKVLDIAIKVYVYYCRYPTEEVAQRIIPFLMGAIDTPIMKHLKTKYADAEITACTIARVDKISYWALQRLVDRDIQQEFGNRLNPIQYDDIMWHQLNRANDASNPSLQ